MSDEVVTNKVAEAVQAVVSEQNNPVVQVAKSIESRVKAGEVVTLSNGIRVKLRPVPAIIIAEVMSAIPDAVMPTFTNPETQQEEANPASPKYAENVAEVARKRQSAAMDAMLFFGVTLVDAVPPIDEWFNDLQFIMKRVGKTLELNREDPNEVKLMYLRYVATDANLFIWLTELSGVSEKEVAQAKQTFPS